MKKFTNFCYVFLNILLFIIVFFWLYFFIDYLNRNNVSSITYYNYSDNLYINTEFENLNTFKIPESVEKHIKEDNWKIFISSKDIEYMFDEKVDLFNDGVGVTMLDSKEIYIEYKNNDYSQAIRTFYHEMGHVFDHYNNITESESWNALYLKYKDKYDYPYKVWYVIPNDYIKTDKNEFFAGIFEAYYLYPEYLKENAAELYDFVNNPHLTNLQLV